MKNFLPYILVTICALLLVIYLNPKMETMTVEDKNLYIPPPKIMKHFGFGFNNAVASILWLRVIQDFDFCASDAPKSFSSVIDLDSVMQEEIMPSRCNQGWVYQMLDRVTDLSPYFRYAYTHGGLMLAIAVDDRIGAKKILDKGSIYFPDDYHLNYHAGYLYMIELKQPKPAAKHFMRAYHAGGPRWMSSLAARLYDKAGARDVAILILREVIRENEGTELATNAEKRLAELLREN